MITPCLTGAVIATTRRRNAPAAQLVQSPESDGIALNAETSSDLAAQAPPATGLESLVPGLGQAIAALSGVEEGADNAGEVQLVASLVSAAIKDQYLATNRQMRALLQTAYGSAIVISNLEQPLQEAILKAMLGKPPRAGNTVFLSVLQVIFDLPESKNDRLAIQKTLSAYGRTLAECAANDISPETLDAYLSERGVGFAKPRGVAASNPDEATFEAVEAARTKGMKYRPDKYGKARLAELAYDFQTEASLEVDLGPMRVGVQPNTEILAYLEISPDSSSARVLACRVLNTVQTSECNARALLAKIKLPHQAVEEPSPECSVRPNFTGRVIDPSEPAQGEDE